MIDDDFVTVIWYKEIFKCVLCTTRNPLKIEPPAFIGAFAKLRKATISFVMFVCASEWNNSASTGWIFIKFYIRVFSEKKKNLSRILKFHSNLTRITGTLHEDQYTIFFIISRSVLLGIRNVSEKSCRGNKNTNCVLNNFFFLSKNVPFMR